MAFNINRNREFQSFEPGEISVQVRQKKDNRWSYDSKIKLYNSDIVYVWTNVQHNQLVYRTTSAPIYVSELLSNNNSITPDVRPNTETSSTTESNTNQCQPSLTTVRNRQVCRGELIFEDNFDASTPLWKKEIYIAPDMGDAEFVFYDDSRVMTRNGELIITAQLWNEYQRNINIRTGVLDVGSR